MHNPYIQYYKTQAGTGLAGYQGVRYQKGHGFFGRILSKAVYPLLRFLGKQAVGTAANIASDVILNKQDLKESANKRLKETAEDITREGVSKAKSFLQGGEGRKRRKVALIKKKKKKSTKIKTKSNKSKKKSIKRKKSTKNAIEKLIQNASTYS